MAGIAAAGNLCDRLFGLIAAGHGAVYEPRLLDNHGGSFAGVRSGIVSFFEKLVDDNIGE